MDLRSKVGIVFQDPDNQLFSASVYKDITFGLKNMGLPEEVIRQRVEKVIQATGIQDIRDKPTHFLSFGQKKRVAIAGVLAMNPEILILDEPTAGLDPKGRDEILQQIKKLQTETGLTILLVSHSMEDVAEYVDRIIVMNKGSVMYDDTPREVFKHYKELEEVGLAAPQVTYIMHELKARGADVDVDATTIEEAAEEIARVWKQNNQK